MTFLGFLLRKIVNKLWFIFFSMFIIAPEEGGKVAFERAGDRLGARTNRGSFCRCRIILPLVLTAWATFEPRWSSGKSSRVFIWKKSGDIFWHGFRDQLDDGGRRIVCPWGRWGLSSGKGGYPSREEEPLQEGLRPLSFRIEDGEEQERRK